ncbi:MAG: toxin-antitoxin system YwqK family antitoxin [Alphaproteobacteria bacterium]|nr:toxin-antitoxin system YwqK family antitoxin [Alphaproteobacteria bacterium]
MKKSLLFLCGLLIVSALANATEYKKEETQACEKDKELLCDLSGNTITGLVKSYKDGVLADEKNYKDGQKDGIAKAYYLDNEQLAAEVIYKNNKLNGPVKAYFNDGSLMNEGEMVDGKKEGIWKTYHPNGKLYAEINFQNDKPDGTVKWLDEDGNEEAVENWKNGKVVSGYDYDDFGEKKNMTKKDIVDLNKYYEKYPL